MDLERFRQFCLAKPGVTEETPFGPDVLVFKVGPPSRKASDGQAKMFALAPLEFFASVNLKCDPERAVELRAEYPGITAGYHAPSPERFGGVRHEQGALEHRELRRHRTRPPDPGAHHAQLRAGEGFAAEEGA